MTNKLVALMVLLGGLAAGEARALPAVALDYNLTALGSDNYKLDYSLANLGEAGGINELILFFNSDDLPGADFPPLSIEDPAGWEHSGSGAVIPPDPGHYAWSVDWVDADPNDPGVVQGESLGGFSVSFHWSNPDAPPGSQFFEAFGARPNEGTTAVTPEPNALALMGSGFGMLGLAGYFRGRRRKVEESK